MLKYKLVIFDLDGTILDTLEDLAAATNYALAAAGLPPRSIDDVRRFVGNGIHRLIALAVPPDTPAATVERVYGLFTAYYADHCADRTRPYPGIEALLRGLRDAGCLTAVVSNKADFAVQELCARYFDGLFDAAVGEREGVRKKPAPDSVNEVLRRLAVRREDAAYVGDSDVDIATARAAAIDAYIVDWGFRDRDFLMNSGAPVLWSTPEAILRDITGTGTA